MQRLPEVTEIEVRKYFFEHPEGADMYGLLSAFPNKRFPPNLLFNMVQRGILTAAPLSKPRITPEWDFRYRLSVETWAKMAYATCNTDTAAADAPGTE